MMPLAAITMLLLVTSFKYNGNDAFEENRQISQKDSTECRKRVDENFTRFAATFKGNFSRIYGNIEELMKIYVSAS